MWLENKKDEDSAAQPGQVNAPTVGAGGGAPTSVSTTPSTGNFSTSSPIQAPQQTQKWATAQDYLRANQPQANELGSKVATSLTGSLGAQKNIIDTAAQTTQKEIESGTTAFKPEIAKLAIDKPTDITSSPAKLQDFLGQWNASYTGPTSFESSKSYTPASEAVTKAKETSEQIKTPGGRNQLLQNQFGVYGAGNQALDTSLLGTASNYQNIQDIGKQFGSLQDYLGQKSAGLSGAAQKAQETTQAAQTQTRAALEGNLKKFQDDLAARVGTTKADAQAKVQGYLTDLASGNADKVAVALKEAGIPEAEIAPLVNNLKTLNTQYKTQPDLTAGLNYNPETAITQANAATPEDYANAEAFAKLTGEQGYLTTLNPANKGQAGTVPKVETGIDPKVTLEQSKVLLDQKDKYLLDNTAIKSTESIPDWSKLSGNSSKDYKTAVTQITPVLQNIIDAAKRQGITIKWTDKNTYPAALKELDKQFHSKFATPPTLGGDQFSMAVARLTGAFPIVKK
jgi:hypothetical protein